VEHVSTTWTATFRVAVRYPAAERYLAFTGAGIRGSFSGTFEAATQIGIDPAPPITAQRGRVDVPGRCA
jgi:hypothetical protein